MRFSRPLRGSGEKKKEVFPRVSHRAALRPRRFTRGYIPSPRRGERRAERMSGLLTRPTGSSAKVWHPAQEHGLTSKPWHPAGGRPLQIADCRLQNERRKATARPISSAEFGVRNERRTAKQRRKATARSLAALGMTDKGGSWPGFARPWHPLDPGTR